MQKPERLKTPLRLIFLGTDFCELNDRESHEQEPQTQAN